MTICTSEPREEGHNNQQSTAGNRALQTGGEVIGHWTYVGEACVFGLVEHEDTKVMFALAMTWSGTAQDDNSQQAGSGSITESRMTLPTVEGGP